MYKLPFLVGITGVAGCGKDTLARILVERLPKAEKWSIASILREDMDELLNRIGVNVWTEDREEKEKIRPLMVEQANVFRKFTNGNYFWKKLEKKLVEYSCGDYACLSDLRNASYEDGEDKWVKRNGVIIHLTAFKNGRKLQPANADEAHNDPVLFYAADYCFGWYYSNDLLSDKQLYESNKQNIDNLIRFIQSKRQSCQNQ